MCVHKCTSGFGTTRFLETLNRPRITPPLKLQGLLMLCRVHLFQLMEHVFYDDAQVHESMLDGVVFTTSVRHPLGQLTSNFHYRKAQKESKHTGTYFVERLEKRYKNLKTVNFSEEGMKYLYLPKNISTNTMAAFVKGKLDKFFQFVMITEHFDESLVLFRRKFCWELKDLLYIPLKVGKYHHTGNKLRGKIPRRKLTKHMVSVLVHRVHLTM